MHIIGTAGHVDHGKSTLIAALTGTHPDRLKEEKDREMTIELGFASLRLPNGEEIGIIDVPGHRDFIGNMLAGIGGIDAALLVIAADEGVSAQTREHLAILDLLDIDRGVIAMTKIDLIEDAEWLELVEMEIRELISGTSLADSPIIPVSARSGEGIEQLLLQIQASLADIPDRKNLGKPRLPVDRVFTLTGFGTVVTGTLLDGTFKIGDEIICLPGGKTSRIRGLQNHHHKLQKIDPGFRAAVNIVNLNHQDIARGDVITHPGDYKPSSLLDAHFRLLPESAFPVKHNMQVKLFINASETTASLRLLGAQTLSPGEEAFIQLRLDHPIVAAKGDRIILRLPSPSETLGGGVVLDPEPRVLYKRFNQSNLDRMDTMLSGTDEDLLIEIIQSLKTSNFATLEQKSALPPEVVKDLITSLLEKEQIISLRSSPNPVKDHFASPDYWQELKEKTTAILNSFHHRNPFKAGMNREDLRAALALSQLIFDATLDKLAAEQQLVQKGNLVWDPDHQVTLSEAQEQIVAPVLAEFQATPFSPPDISKVEASIGPDLLEGLISSGRLIAVSDSVLFTPEAIHAMQDWVREIILQNGDVSLAQLRDHFQNSRKYASATLEYFDSIGFTYRKGDVRGLR